jgi:uncharacterized protein YoxC
LRVKPAARRNYEPDLRCATIPPIFATIANVPAAVQDVLESVADILAPIAHVLASITNVFQTIASSAVVPRVAYILATVANILASVTTVLEAIPDVLATITHVFAPVPDVLDTVATDSPVVNVRRYGASVSGLDVLCAHDGRGSSEQGRGDRSHSKIAHCVPQRQNHALAVVASATHTTSADRQVLSAILLGNSFLLPWRCGLASSPS